MEAKDPQRLVIAVGDALPRLQGAPGDRSDLAVRLDFGEQVVAAAKGGVEAAAQAAYRAGFRAGERYGQRLAAATIRDRLDDRTGHVFQQPETRWRKYTADHAHQWVVDANQEVVRASSHHIPTGSLAPLLRRAVPDWSEVPRWAGKGLPEIAAFAYDLGYRSSQDRAYTFTEEGISRYAYSRAADLGVNLTLVDADLWLTPDRRPAGFTAPATEGSHTPASAHPSALASSSFAAPATATSARPATTSQPRPAAAPRHEQAGRRSR